MNGALKTNDNARGSLIERAAEVYDFQAALRGRVATIAFEQEPQAESSAPANAGAQAASAEPADWAPAFAGAQAAEIPAAAGTIDRARLLEDGYILPDVPVGALAEEFRLVKRQLLLRPAAEGAEPSAKDRMVMICSAHPNEGKTFCAVNLALSLASELDREVLLVDADVAKPGVLSVLGLSGSGGLIDAIADSDADVEAFVIQTDIPKLSVLPAGRASNDDTELLSSARAAQVIESLAAKNPRRIVILDSAPALAASPAAVLAHHVGRVLVVVRADHTREADLREAIALLDGCGDIALLLNGTSFFGTNRTYGSYYGAEA